MPHFEGGPIRKGHKAGVRKAVGCDNRRPQSDGA
jgi:hypothetical protein